MIKPHSQKSAAILAIGTELTTGQIVDTNSAWLANELVDLGFHLTAHLNVPDHSQAIEEALKFLAACSDFIITTGGLGPTSDDITRDIVAKWAGQPLVYHEASWQHIVRRFASRGTDPGPANKQQCYYPQSAVVLENHNGTAHGFWTEAALPCLSLPGPPAELKPLFAQVRPRLEALNQGHDPLRLFRWHLLGKSEADVGELVERLIQGSPLVAGYRPHRPYVEVKIWCPESCLSSTQDLRQSLDQALQPWTMGRDDEDLAQLVMHAWQHYPIVFIRDLSSSGNLQQRLAPFIKAKAESQRFVMESHWGPGENSDSSLELPEGGLGVQLGPLDENGCWQVLVVYQGLCYEHQLKLSEPMMRRQPLQRAYQVEMTMQYWLEQVWLDKERRCP